MAQVQKVPLADQAAELLLSRIRAGEWELGGKLPGETTLGPQLGVGRSTVREAIRQLAGRGVLVTRQGAGVFVAALDVRDDWDVAVRRADIRSVIEARIAIEAEAAALAATRRTPADLRALRRALAARDRARDTLDGYVDADTAFHRSIVVAAHNPILLELFDGFTPRIREAMIDLLRIGGGVCATGQGSGVAGPGRFGSDADQAAHAGLADAVAERDATGAARRSREHLVALADAFGADPCHG